MKTSALDGHFAVLDRQRAEALGPAAGLSTDQLWRKPSSGEWSIGEWLDHLYRTLRVQRIACRLYVPLARPIASRLRHRPYETEVEDRFADPGTTVPGPSLPLFRARRPKADGQPRGVQTSIDHLDRETAALRRALDLDEPVAGHIVYRDLRFGWLNVIQSVQVAGFHEKNDFAHVADVGRRLGYWD